MGILKKYKDHMDVIRCDEPSYLIWKWHPAGSQHGSDNRENAIRWGSSLRVKDGEVAVFVYSHNKEVAQDFIVGPFDQILKTANLPVLSNIVGLAYDGASPFQAEVYFINLAKIIQVRFAVPYFDVYDPRFDDFGVPVAVRGTISFCIQNYREFIKLHRLSTFSLDTFQTQIKDTLTRYIKDVIANAPSKYNIPLVQIESKTSQINDEVGVALPKIFKEIFGVNTHAIDISTIELDKTSVSYQQLMQVTKDVDLARVQAETEAKVKDIHDKQRIEVENYEEELRIQREESQYAMHKNTQSANIAAFQLDKQAEVGVAGADALGQMGANGGGNINLSGGNELNMTNMMASMAIGGVVGQNIAGAMTNMMSGMNRSTQENMTPPPIKCAMYNVVVEGKATGPYNIDMLGLMARNGELLSDTLVWTQGMDDWIKAAEIDELKGLFVKMPPIPES